MGIPIFSYEIQFLHKYHIVVLYEIEVKMLVLLHLLRARTEKAPIQIQNGRCHLAWPNI